MYNRDIIQRLISFVAERDGITNKQALSNQIQSAFALVRDRSVFACNDFAIRFCTANHRSFSNTVLSLSSLQKYDAIPFIVCLVSPQKNSLLLANTTFLKKISHSSQELRIDNIRGSFNGSDIIRNFEGIDNAPNNFEYLFASHENFSFAENLERLVEATNDIHPRRRRFAPNVQQVDCIIRSVKRADDFLKSVDYETLNADLQARVHAVASEIAIAAFIDNVNLRGRIIEYLITSADDLRKALIDALRAGRPLPPVYTADELGDYERIFEDFITETDIKTKVLFLSSNPKGYNIDKLLSFLAKEGSVYLIYVIAIDEHKRISTQLCSIYNRQILNGTRVLKLWAGRDTRGVTQFDGTALESAILDYDCSVDTIAAEQFIKTCLDI